MTSLYNSTYNHIINSYIDSYIKLISLNCKSSYQRIEFNFFGKKDLYNDYKKIINNELEAIRIINNILNYIEKDINN